MHVLQRLFFGNYILSVALLSWLAAQICKTIINYILSGKFEAERMWGAGGMPSAHSALVCSMFMAAAKSQGVNSPIFAIAFILAAIVMYDAMGVRRETGEQAKVLQPYDIRLAERRRGGASCLSGAEWRRHRKKWGTLHLKCFPARYWEF